MAKAIKRCAQIGILVVLMGFPRAEMQAQGPPTAEEVTRALQQAVAFTRQELAYRGGYLWRYSADLQHREGEGAASRTTAWVQPPGTPTFGATFLRCYQLSGEQPLLDAARETAQALLLGQLNSGGWDYRIEFEPPARDRYAYRADQRTEGRNTTTLDDDTTQSALQFLMRLDRELGFQDERLHESVTFALQSLLEAQYPIGAWPQRFDAPPDPAQFPPRDASYPDTWSRVHPDADYRGYYTFNDNAIADMVQLFLDAEAVYQNAEYGAAARRAGEFILRAQMPEPQPAWAQQYTPQMQPAWARRFEPAAVTGGESQGVLQTLLLLYRRTGEERFLEPVPRAIAYLRSSQLPDGRLARFYELQTNRPLYFTRQYALTYEDNDLPTHYAFQVGSRLDSLQRTYEQLRERGPDGGMPEILVRPAVEGPPSGSLTRQVNEVLASMDERGTWVEPGRLRAVESESERVIEARTVQRNLEILAAYLAAVR